MSTMVIEHALSRDWSVGTEAFRDSLLERCLSVLGSDNRSFDLADDELEMLAAAGIPDSLEREANDISKGGKPLV